MSHLIGRHGGGHGGHGRGRGGRRFFGGGGYGWYPYGYGWDYGYGAPLAYPGDQGVTEEVEEVEETVTGNELMELLPALAPAGGVATTQELGQDLVLRVSICVDGRCYCGEVDLSDVLADIAAGVTAEHARAHGAHDVAEDIEVGRRHRSASQAQPHHRHHRHHHRRRREQQEEQDQQDQDQGQDDRIQSVVQPIAQPIVQPTALDPTAAAAQLAAALAAVQAAAQAATAGPGGGHHRDGRAPASSPQAVSDVKQQGDAAVKAAGEVLVGALYDQHFNAPELGFRPGDFSLGLVGGWWDDVKGAATAVVAPVYAIHKAILSNPDVAKLLNDHKGELSMAAGAVATAYGGPAGGAAAAQLTGPIIESLSSGNSTQLIAGLAQQAQNDPTVAQAMQTAQKAVAHTTAAYHLTDTAARAASGDHVAARKIAQVDRAASGGDAAAQTAMEIIAHAFRILQGGGSPTIAGAAPRGSSAAAARALRREGAVAAEVLRGQGGARVVGFVKTRGGGPVEGRGGTVVTMTEESMAMPFPSLDDADDWFGSLDPGETVYAAYYDAGDPTWPAPLNETFGRRPGMTRTSGDLAQGSVIASRPQEVAWRSPELSTDGDHAPGEVSLEIAKVVGLRAALDLHLRTRARVVGVIYWDAVTNQADPSAFRSVGEGLDWFARALRHAPDYVALYAWDDSGNRRVIKEWNSSAGETVTSGIGVIPWLGMTPPWLALTAAGAAGYWLHGQWQKYQARQ